MAKKKKIDYGEVFSFPDIPYQTYPVYAISGSGKLVNIKAMMYPSARSRKRYTRRKQLVFRSCQAKIFDALINIGYWDPLMIVREFPVVIQNSLRLPGQSGMFYYLDYYFPTLKLAVELDSDLHEEDSDAIRDKYLEENLGIKTFRIHGLDKEASQKGRFKELIKYIRNDSPQYNSPEIFAFGQELRLAGYV